nr:hypothetical protein DGKKSRWO_DGKKSRWO_CDS_0190 [uncultured phage]CAI9752368.1 hypothetical protein CVNMHQAP_CVNMHQAP_CDS_0191 [uncultured phage]
MYIYSMTNNKVELVGQSKTDQIITQETYPARIDTPNTKAVLSYNETDGIHWEYIPLTPTELRERTYETVKCITYENEQLTVDEANKKWQEYQAEGNTKATELTQLIRTAKESIRQQYPD